MFYYNIAFIDSGFIFYYLRKYYTHKGFLNRFSQRLKNAKRNKESISSERT